MIQMTSFQEFILDMLIHNHTQAYKLRKNHRKTVDKVFSEFFGPSFGFEIEVNKEAFVKDMRHMSKKVDKFSKIKLNKDEDFPKARIYYDPPCYELACPQSPKHLMINKKSLKIFKDNIKDPQLIDVEGDNHSSMHIHMLEKETKIKDNEKKHLREKVITHCYINNELLHKLFRNSAKSNNTIILIYIDNICGDIYRPASFGLSFRKNPDYNNYNDYEFRFMTGTLDINIVMLRAMMLKTILNTLLNKEDNLQRNTEIIKRALLK